jgi:hypothetical protein
MGYTSIHVCVDMDEVWSEIDDDDFRKEMTRRFKGEPPVDFDLLGEIEWYLLHGQHQAALAMIESARTASRIPDAIRSKQIHDARHR